MNQYAHVPAREPVSDFLRPAACLSLELQPETLPSGAGFLSAAAVETLDPLQYVEEPHRRMALNTTFTLCAEHAGKRLYRRACTV